MLKFKTGDLLEATEGIIGHQVNCYGVAGGLAAAVFEKWPEAESDYLQLTGRAMTGRQLLGLVQVTGLQKDGHIIANLYGQLHPGADYRPKALREALETLAELASKIGKSVALPYRLSCGICGGDWNEVRRMIGETMAEMDVECVIYVREEDMNEASVPEGLEELLKKHPEAE